MPQFSSESPPPPRVLHSTLAADAIGSLVESSYGILPLSSRLLRRGFNDTYVIEAGEGGRLIARLSPHDPSNPSRAEFETALLSRLPSLGAPVAAPIPNNAGSPWQRVLAPEGERALLLMPFVEGQAWTPRRAHARALGETLARVHETELTPATEGAKPLDREHLLEQPFAALQLAGFRHPALGMVAEQLVSDLERRLRAIEGYLTIGCCHGDCHGGNVIIRSKGGGAVDAFLLDFSDSGRGPFAYDLATFLWGLEVAHPIRRAWLQRPIWSSFLAGYRSVRPLMPADLQAISMFKAVRSLWLLGQYALRTDIWGAAALSEQLVATQLRIAKRSLPRM